ncbi:MAG: hypothetical protein ACYDGR_02290 [Candidatus Dormibacteria bacterium]
MSHLDSGTLRRSVDEPFALGEPQRRHLDACEHCRSIATGFAADAARASRLLAVDAEAPDAQAALRQVHARIGNVAARRRPGTVDRARAALSINRGHALRPVGALALTTTLLVALVVSGAANGMLSAFEPKTVAPVSVSPGSFSFASFRGLPDLAAYGTPITSKAPQFGHAGGAADAAAQTGLKILVPAYIPSNVPLNPRWATLQAFSYSFTFDLAKARAAAAKIGRTLPDLPANLNGTTLVVNGGPGALLTYAPTEAPPAASNDAAPGARGGPSAFLGNLPSLGVIQMKAPTVQSNGATVKQLEDALLAIPGIPDQLKAEVRAIGDPSTTLPIPVPASGVGSKTVKIQGADAVAIGDNTGTGAAVIWVKDGEVFAVAGLVTVDDVVKVARSMQ